MDSILSIADELAQSGMLEIVLTAAGLPAVAAAAAGYRAYKNKGDGKTDSTNTNKSWLQRWH